jgi:ATP-dependent helicase HepA
VTDPAHKWTEGDYLTHRFNPELGVGRVTAVEGRALVVQFTRTGKTLRIAANSDALARIDESGSGIRDPGSGFKGFERPIGTIDDEILRDVRRLRTIRESGIGSFLGGRVRLFPHQLYVAERATAAAPVRWLLADEVGLGKTIEACLILNHLVHAGSSTSSRQGVERCLIVVPEALTVQWLGELWRKYHHVFTLLDGPRLADVERDFGPGFNPFDVHRRSVIALETLTQRPELTQQAVIAGIDLLIVDEAQRLRRPHGHPGDARYRATAPIAALGRHVLLLSATPLEDDAHGFFRLLQLLRPDEFPDEVSVEERLASGTPLPPCTSSTRRSDIGGLPARVGIRIDLADDVGSQRRADVEAALRGEIVGRLQRAPTDTDSSDGVPSSYVGAGFSRPPSSRPAERQEIDRIRRALASGAALAAVLGPQDRELRQQAEAMDKTDPRLAWLLANAPRWRAAKEKTLIFVAHRETLEMLRTALSHRAQLASGVFHEDLSAARRDTEVARFRDLDGPSLMVSTEAGGEGRNFEFCRRLILFDLPWKPTVVEQRIGRLDRIGRNMPVEIVYFRPATGIGADAVRVFETLGVFREPLAGLEPQLAHVESALEEIALDGRVSLTDERLDQLVADARAARTRIREAAYQQLHRDPYRPDMGAGILARVPSDLDALIERLVTTTCARLGFRVEHLRGRRIFAIEFGNDAIVDSLPGVPGGTAYVGTFDREEAVEDESIDFFASGHPLVEAVLAYFEDEEDKRRVTGR